MNTIGRQMQQDRIDGNTMQQDYEKRRAYLASLGAVNTRPPLPQSPYVKVLATGEIHVWSHFFADRPDLCVNCDEHGNTDPAVWSTQTLQQVEQPRSSSPVSTQLYTSEKPTAVKSTDLMFFTEENEGELVVEDDFLQYSTGAILGHLIPEAAPFEYKTETIMSGSVPGAVPQINTAPAVLGIPVGFTQDYTDPIITKAALPLPKIRKTGESVIGVIQDAFSQHSAT